MAKTVQATASGAMTSCRDKEMERMLLSGHLAFKHWIAISCRVHATPKCIHALHNDGDSSGELNQSQIVGIKFKDITDFNSDFNLLYSFVIANFN